MNYLIRQFDKDGALEDSFFVDSAPDFCLSLSAQYPFIQTSLGVSPTFSWKCYVDKEHVGLGIAEKRYTAYQEGSTLYHIWGRRVAR